MASNQDLSSPRQETSESASPIPDGAVLLPNGRLICSSHYLMICCYCKLDLSHRKENDDVDFDTYDHRAEQEKLRQLYEREPDPAPMMLEDAPRQPREVIDLTTEPDEDTPSHQPPSQTGYMKVRPEPLWIGFGKVVPKEFRAPPYQVPSSLFSDKAITSHQFPRRFVRNTNPKEFLIYVDVGLVNGKWGCAFKFHSFSSCASERSGGTISFPLEEESPTDPPNQPARSATSTRARLRAILAALRYRDWTEDEFTSLVIAVNSQNLVECATACIEKWIVRGWNSIGSNRPIADRDLWTCLIGEIEKLHDGGLSVSFWNTRDSHEPHLAAEQAALLPSPQHFYDIVELTT